MELGRGRAADGLNFDENQQRMKFIHAFIATTLKTYSQTSFQYSNGRYLTCTPAKTCTVTVRLYNYNTHVIYYASSFKLKHVNLRDYAVSISGVMFPVAIL